MISVMVCGAAGRMGREVVRAVLSDMDTQLVAAVDPAAGGQDAGALATGSPCGVTIASSLGEALRGGQPQVAVDFSLPKTVAANIRALLEHGISPVVGTTGLAMEEMQTLDALSRERNVPGLVAPNFAIGAVLMMRMAADCSRYFEHAEIIEYHHEKKLDAPSGTAVKTAQLMAAARGSDFQHPGGDEAAEGSAAPHSRGGTLGGVALHSVRMPGYLAHQEVIFGLPGQTLSIRHDTITRECYMPGVLLAIKAVRGLQGLVYGLENIL